MITKAPVESQGHVFALMARCAADDTRRFTDPATSAAFRAALDYLSAAVSNDGASADVFARAHETDEWKVLEAAIALREILGYRAYLVEWIARGKPTPDTPPTAPALVPAEVTVEAQPQSLVKRVAGQVAKAFRTVSSRFGKRQVPGRNAWTGTSGTTSYYDKDSSPD